MSRRLSGLSRTDVVLGAVFLAALLVLLLPYVYQQRLRQRRTMCEERQTKTAGAMLAWEAAEKHFPGYSNPLNGKERVATSWVSPILPQLTNNLGKIVPELVCPDNRPPDLKTDITWLAWVVNSGLPDAAGTDDIPPDWPANGVFLDRFTLPQHAEAETSVEYLEAHDGAAHTLLLSENIDAGRYTDSAEARVAFVWSPGLVSGEPDPSGVVLRINQERGRGDGSLRYARPASNHRGGVNAVFCDGSSRFLNDRLDYLVFCRLMTCDDRNLRQAGSNVPLPPPYGLKRDEN